VVESDTLQRESVSRQRNMSQSHVLASQCGVFLGALAMASVLAKFFEIPGQASAWYPPAGVLLAFFAVVQRKHRASVVPLAVFARVSVGYLLYRSIEHHFVRELIEAAAIVVLYMAASFLIDHIDSSRGDLVEFGRFVLVTVLVAFASAVMSSVIERAFGMNTSWEKLRTFAVGDAIGIEIIVPVVGVLYRFRHRILERRYAKPLQTTGRIELGLQAITVIAVPVITFATGYRSGAAYWMLSIIPMMWIALRSDLLYAMLGVTVANIAVAFAARYAFGPDSRLVDVQIMLLAGNTAAGYIIAVVRSRNARMEELSERERRITQATRSDQITGLPNRYGLLELVGANSSLPIATSAPEPHDGFGKGKPLTVIVVDIIKFADVLDGLGLNVGNAILGSVAKRLQDVGGPKSVVARVEGDTFAIALTTNDMEIAHATAERALEAIRSEPFEAELGLYLTARAGYAIEGRAENGDDTLRNANIALRTAKKELSAAPILFYDYQRVEAVENRALITSLRYAINEDPSQIHLMYQPIVDTQAGHVVGAEALARWTHPELGPIATDRFIGLAERSGLMRDLGFLVLERAIAQMGHWVADLGDRHFRLHVNVSPQQLADESLPGRLAVMCVKSGVKVDRIMIELTETALGLDPLASVYMLSRLKSVGVSIGLDDFGTGFSTIGWLSKFPIDELKIDQSFVAGLPEREDDLAIVKLILGLARDLSLTVTAEGVERVEQLDVLRSLQCKNAQGYLFGRPMPAEAFTSQLLSL
jgi:diguanylate cyclase (GGDEF)-like protein